MFVRKHPERDGNWSQVEVLLFVDSCGLGNAVSKPSPKPIMYLNFRISSFSKFKDSIIKNCNSV